MNSVSLALDVNIETIPPISNGDESLPELQWNTDQRNTFWHVLFFDFYKISLANDKFTVLRDCAQRMRSLFGSIHDCKQFFPEMKVVKSKSTNILDD
jgi:hypothetical protein